MSLFSEMQQTIDAVIRLILFGAFEVDNILNVLIWRGLVQLYYIKTHLIDVKPTFSVYNNATSDCCIPCN